ncbi:hypothetical protein trd_A0848 (plasmid) [Thermomicrobium roseum DSM 5159]|uniref:Uncharacterized protein n=1 Tax=Thermomicrobium roseum (strain ATCC 27502 / DSM 5159 / P-2) TaxID=309801 RepID=B9L4Y4_THERP|nr:hypothetical protein trd_A0848 [Thermomicrobium roseum DSM 5159]
MMWGEFDGGAWSRVRLGRHRPSVVRVTAAPLPASRVASEDQASVKGCS